MRRSRFTVFVSVASVAAFVVVVPTGRAAGEFAVSSATLSFPATYVGDTATIEVTVTNVSSSTLTPNFAGGAPGDSANFGGSQNCAGVTFAPGDSCEFAYTFEPASPGSHSSSTTIGVDADDFSISMSGTGLNPIDVSPTTLTFPDTAVGAMSSLEVVVTNISPVAQTPSYAGGAPGDSTNFDGSQNCGGVTLAASATCAFTYTFQPTTPGPVSSSTTIEVDGVDYGISMSGNGIDPSTSTTTTTATSLPTDSTEPGATTGPAGSTSTAPGSTTAPSAPPVLPGGVVRGPLVAGHAEVIAQGVVDFPAGSFGWDHQALGPGGWPFPFSGSPASFVAVDGPDALLLSGSEGSAVLLDVGEAQFVPAGSSGSASPTFDGAVAVARRITFVPGSGQTAFTPGPGRRDVNLIRDVLAAGEAFTVSSPFPILVSVVDGDIGVGGTDAETTAGTAGTFGGTTLDPTAPNPIEIRNNNDTGAVVLVAAVGAPVP